MTTFQRKTLLALLLAICIPFCAHGDKLEKFILYGYINELNDSTGYQSLDSVEVSLMFNDSIPVNFKVLSGDDSLKISNSSMRLLVDGGRGRYDLRLFKEGYDPFFKEVLVTAVSQDMVYAGSLRLQPERNVHLDGIEVKATAIKMVMQGDTIVYNADAFDLSEGSMLESLVHMFPGAEITPEGQIKVNGRVLNELLINGKDFFSGDPEVALKNLPAYTVDKVKVYDKASEDSYLTHSDAKLSKRENEENLVMDVYLKKEYNTGFIANVEAGYGLHHRYTGRLFGLMFTDNLRLSVFGNFNNCNNYGKASTDGFWQSHDAESGDQDYQTGGMDYMYDKGRWRSTGNIQASNTVTYNHEQTALTSFYDSGDIYERLDSRYHTKARSASLSSNTEYKHDIFYLQFTPNVQYNDNADNTRERSATFSRQPDESRRMESIDSLFSDSPIPSRFERYMMNRLGSISVSKSRNFSAGGNVRATIRPAEMKGMLTASASGSYRTAQLNRRNLYDQILGPESPEGTKPTDRDSYLDRPDHYGDYSGSISYKYEKNRFSDTHKQSYSLTATALYNHRNANNGYNYWLTDDTDYDEYFREDLLLPSLTRPDNSYVDTDNTYRMHTVNNNLDVSLVASWSNDYIVESDSGINPSFGVTVKLTDEFRHKYARRTEPAEVLSRMQRYNHLQPSVSFQFGSSNKSRYLSLSLNYSMRRTAPEITSLIRSTQSANPFLVVENGLEDLRDATTHDIDLMMYVIGRTGHRPGMYTGVSFSSTSDAFGQSKRYDPATGISYIRRVNVDGNMRFTVMSNQWLQFGADNNWSVADVLYYSYTRSVDFVTATSGMPVKSLVNSNLVSVGPSISYSFGKGSNVGLKGKVVWQGSRSDRPNFNPINICLYKAGTWVTIKLPLDFEIKTEFGYSANRGYDDNNMNSDELLWNASASKSILKGSLIFSVFAFDILGQRSSISTTVDAQGSTEIWRNTLPRYVMFKVAYRFNHTPKKNANKAEVYNFF